MREFYLPVSFWLVSLTYAYICSPYNNVVPNLTKLPFETLKMNLNILKCIHNLHSFLS